MSEILFSLAIFFCYNKIKFSLINFILFISIKEHGNGENIGS